MGVHLERPLEDHLPILKHLANLPARPTSGALYFQSRVPFPRNSVCVYISPFTDSQLSLPNFVITGFFPLDSLFSVLFVLFLLFFLSALLFLRVFGGSCGQTKRMKCTIPVLLYS